MKRFVKNFYAFCGDRAVEEQINDYAEVNNLKIITITAATGNGIYVLFEESKDIITDIDEAIRATFEQSHPANVEEVVRCKDCLYSYYNTSSLRYTCQREYPRRSVEEDDYCRYGRRSENEISNGMS